MNFIRVVNTPGLVVLMIVITSSALAKSDVEACKQWSRDFQQVSKEAKSKRATLKKYMPKNKNMPLDDLEKWKKNVDNATYVKIVPLVKALEDLNKRGKRLFDLMRKGECKVT